MDNFTAITYSVSNISDISEFLPLFAWLLYAGDRKPYNILGYFFLVSAFIKLFTLITAEFFINNMPAFHFLAAIEIIMLFCFYSLLTFGKVSYPGIILLLILNAVNTLFIQDIFTFNSLAWTINMMVLIGMGLLYLFRLYKNEDDYTPLERRPDFIITSGWLIYASGSLFTYLLGTSILSGEPQGFFHNAWIIQCIANLSKNIILSYGLWLLR